MALPFKISRPLIFFDLETTGLDFKYDRIIELGAYKLQPNGDSESFLKKVNPQMKIPAEVEQLTGISNSDVASAPTFAQIFSEVEKFFENADLGGYHIGRFDNKVMVEEFKRAGSDFKLDSRFVVDAQAIFHQKEKRDLSAAFKFYCDKDLVGAHSAHADTMATYEIFLAQLQRYPDLPHNVEELHKISKGPQERFVDSEGKFFWRDGEAVFNFGKYKSLSLKVVTKDHPEYLHWVISPERQFSQDVIDICYKAMKGVFPTKAAVE
ncbi:MAG: exonuclease domain-containing protein [Elusimicrobiota bacterium]